MQVPQRCAAVAPSPAHRQIGAPIGHSAEPADVGRNASGGRWFGFSRTIWKSAPRGYEKRRRAQRPCRIGRCDHLHRRRRTGNARRRWRARTLSAVGAVDTMEEFFEKLNEGDRAGAVSLMDERVEMRIHVGDNARTLRGVEQVGGWFLRAEPGLKMIPGEVRDLGITYQADVLSVRPGAPSQNLDASFRVEAGKITSINLAPR